MTTADPAVLDRLRAGLAALYGPRLERAVLFGSRARGDAHPDSDYDVAVFLRDRDPSLMVELRRLSEVTQPILEEVGAVINVLPIRAEAYDDRTPLMHEIRHEGQEL